MSDSHGAAPASSEPTLKRKFLNLTGVRYDKKLDAKIRYGSETKQVERLSADLEKMGILLLKDYSKKNPLNDIEKSLQLKSAALVNKLSAYGLQLEANEATALDAAVLAKLHADISDVLDSIITDAEWDNKPRNAEAIAPTVQTRARAAGTAKDMRELIADIQNIAKNGIDRTDLVKNVVRADCDEGKKLIELRNDIEQIIEEIQTSDYMQHMEGHAKIQELATAAKGTAGKLITRDPSKDNAITLQNIPTETRKLTDLLVTLRQTLTAPDPKITFQSSSTRSRLWRAFRSLIAVGALTSTATVSELTMDTYGPLQMVGLRDRANFDHLEGKNIAQLVDAKAIVIADRAMNPRIQRKMIEEIDERIAVLEKEYAALGDLNSDELQALEKAEKKNLDRASGNAAARIQEKIGKINERIRNLTAIKGGHVEGAIGVSPKISLASGYTAQRAGNKVIIETPAGAIDKGTFAIAYQGKGQRAHADCTEVSDGKFEFAISAEDANSDLIRIRVILRDTNSPTGWTDMATQDLRAR